MIWADRLLMVGAFTAFFSGYLFTTGPAVNNAQLTFRVGLLILGGALLIAGGFLKAKRRG